MIKKFSSLVNENMDNPQIIRKNVVNPRLEPSRYNKIIDYTFLREDANIDKIEEICKDAIKNGFYSVCIRPKFVSYAYNFLDDSDIKICTVVSFPDGNNKTTDKVAETQKAISNGADEIDMVMNWKLLKKWSTEPEPKIKTDILEKLYNDIRKVVDVCHGSDSIVLKVIIESGELTLDEVKKACDICLKAGADYVKTSTGYANRGAEVDKVKFMRSVLPDYVKIKASGGIRTLQDIEKFVLAGADRIGTSSNPAIIQTDIQSGY